MIETVFWGEGALPVLLMINALSYFNSYQPALPRLVISRSNTSWPYSSWRHWRNQTPQERQRVYHFGIHRIYKKSKGFLIINPSHFINYAFLLLVDVHIGVDVYLLHSIFFSTVLNFFKISYERKNIQSLAGLESALPWQEKHSHGHEARR